MKFLKALLIIALAVFLSACGKDPSERGCQDSEVQTLAKKLLLMHINDLMKPRTDMERLMDSTEKKSVNPGLDAKLNALKTEHLNVDGVALGEVTQLKGPNAKPNDTMDAKNPDGDTGLSGSAKAKGAMNAAWEKYLFVCSSKASISVPKAAIEKAENIAKVIPGFVDSEKSRMNIDIIYTTEGNKKKDLVVGMALQNPLLDIALGVLLRNEKE